MREEGGILLVIAIYFALMAGFIFMAGFIILWLLQQFHVIGGCVC